MFDHSSSPLKLTYAGQRYYEYVLRTKAMEENIHKELSDIERDESGLIKLGIPFWRGACVLPQVFPSFHEQYPNINLVLYEAGASKIIALLLDGKIDLAIINITQTFNYPTLLCETIFMERILLAVPVNHPEVKKILQNNIQSNGYPSCSIEIVNQIPLIISKPEQHITIAVKNALAQKNIQPNILLTTENQTTAINIVATGIGCTFVPEAGAKVCHRPGSVVYLAIDLPTLVWPLAAVFRKDIYLPKRCRLFIDLVKKSLDTKQ